jgi:hypothetical protein
LFIPSLLTGNFIFCISGIVLALDDFLLPVCYKTAVNEGMFFDLLLNENVLPPYVLDF